VAAAPTAAAASMARIGEGWFPFNRSDATRWTKPVICSG
jgi:hypothetical protein